MTEPITQHVRWELDYDIHLGETWARFLAGLRDKRILANTNSVSNRVYVPPQAYCEESFVPNDTWLELPQEGNLETFTIVHQGFAGGPTPPYALGAVTLDGASTMLVHLLGGIDLSDPSRIREQLPEGRRVRVHWAENRTGEILDIAYFEPAD